MLRILCERASHLMGVAPSSFLALACTLVVCAAAEAHPDHGPIVVQANGDPLFGGLGFAPAEATVLFNDAVQWTNTSDVAAHDATEEHGLFASHVEPKRIGEVLWLGAGTFKYHCTIHPSMRGSVSAAPYAYIDTRTVKKRKRIKKRGKNVRYKTVKVLVGYVVVTWGVQAPGYSLVYDVQRRRPGGAWETFADGTSTLSAAFKGGATGSKWELRARLRRLAEADKASDWSPLASVTV